MPKFSHHPQREASAPTDGSGPPKCTARLSSPLIFLRITWHFHSPDLLSPGVAEVVGTRHVLDMESRLGRRSPECGILPPSGASSLETPRPPARLPALPVVPAPRFLGLHHG